MFKARNFFCTCFILLFSGTWAYSDFVGPPVWKNTEIQCDMPMNQYSRNSVGTDGRGLCVFASISHSARFQNIELLKDMLKYMEKHPGGGYPKKVDNMIKQIAEENNHPIPDYIQIEGSGKEVAELVALATLTRRMVCVTWGTDDARYKGQKIAHMVNCVYLGDQYACILDNNYPSEYLWCTRKEFEYRIEVSPYPYSTAWAIIFLAPPPPMPPKNLIGNCWGQEPGPAVSRATITVKVDDSNAIISVNGKQTSQKGLVREYYTTELSPGTYKYTVVCTWPSGEQQTKFLMISPGKAFTLEFTSSPKFSLLDFGVDVDKLSNRLQVTLSGNLVSMNNAKSRLKDDRDIPTFVILAKNIELRNRVVQEAASIVGSNYHIQAYLLTDWPNENNLYKVTSDCCILIQQFDGTVLARRDYINKNDISLVVETANEQLRKPGPYDPNKDPKEPDKPKSPTDQSVDLWETIRSFFPWIIIIILLLALFRK